MIMYAIIANTKNMSTALRYSQDKLKDGRAELLIADNFLQDAAQLTRQDIKDRFRDRISLNEGTLENIVRSSLNFHTDEKISNEKMGILTNRYMQGMGL